MTKRSKFIKVNVPETFFQLFLAQKPVGESAVVDALQTIQPIERGRGLTRVMENVTEEQWNELYNLAAETRAHIRGVGKNFGRDHLKAAICAKSMADRMEKLGVANPVPYETRETLKKKALLAAALEALSAPKVPDVISTPITLAPTPDLQEVDPEELSQFNADQHLGSAQG
jgi:hypothetical protein